MDAAGSGKPLFCSVFCFGSARDRHGLEENFVAEATARTAHNRESWDKIDRIYLTDWHSGAKLTMYFDMSF
jgi:hypothetical protein